MCPTTPNRRLPERSIMKRKLFLLAIYTHTPPHTEEKVAPLVLSAVLHKSEMNLFSLETNLEEMTQGFISVGGLSRTVTCLVVVMVVDLCCVVLCGVMLCCAVVYLFLSQGRCAFLL